MRSRRCTPRTSIPFPVVTGQDAELSAIQRILTGDQYMTVYKAIKPQAELAAEVAVALLKGEKVTAPLEIQGTPATLLDPVAVTIDNILETVVADGFWTVDDICTPAYEDGVRGRRPPVGPETIEHRCR